MEWDTLEEAMVELFPSVRATGNVARRDVAIITSPRTSTACAVVLLDLEQLLLLILRFPLQWTHRRTLATAP